MAMESMIDRKETAAIIRAILTSRKCSLSVSQLNRDFKHETGFDIPVFEYPTVSSFLHSLVHTVKLDGLYPVENVSLIKNEKSGHIVSLVMRQKNPEDKWNEVSKSAAAKQSEGGSPADKRMRPRRALKEENDNQVYQWRKIPENEDDETDTFPIDEETDNYFQKSSLSEKENAGFVKRSLTPKKECGERKWYEGCNFESASLENERVSGFKKPVSHKTETATEEAISSITKKFPKLNLRAGDGVKSHEEYLFKPLSSEEEDESDISEPEPHGNKSIDSFKEHASPGMKQTGSIQKSIPETKIEYSVQVEAARPKDVFYKSPLLKDGRKSIHDFSPCGRIPDLNLSEHAETGSFLEIRLGKINTPEHFYFSLKKYEYKLSKILSAMQIFYSFNGDFTILPEKDIKIGQACAVRYKKLGKKELMWQRGEIAAIYKKRVVISLSDTGQIAEVLNHRVKYLYEEFGDLPKQAILGTLAHIRPPNRVRCWSYRSTKRFIDLAAGKDVITRVVSVNREEARAFLTLTSTIDKLHINDVLVAEGLAKYDTAKTDAMLAETFRSLFSITEGTQTERYRRRYRRRIPRVRPSVESGEEELRRENQRRMEQRRGRGRGNLRIRQFD